MSARATRLTLSLAIALVTCCAFAVRHARAADDLPRYKLQPGMEIEYKQQGSVEYDGQKIHQGTTWRIYVAHENADGSFDCLVAVKSAKWRGDKKPDDDKSNPRLARVVLFPDGRIGGEAMSRLFTFIRTIYPQLPESHGAARRGWEAVDAELAEAVKYDPPIEKDNTLVFEAKAAGVLDDIYAKSTKSTITFDREKQLVTRVETKTSSDKHESTTVAELVSVNDRGRAFADELHADMQAYFPASKLYADVGDRITEHPDRVDSLLEEAREGLASLKGKLKNELLEQRLEAELARVEQNASYYRDNAKQVAEVLGKPAPDWKAKDFAGKEHSAADYRGKVVVLDFWFRGCSWCIRAMPQIKQIAEQYQDQPVAVLGVNTDSDLRDAQAVVDRLQLPYTNLQASEIAKDFKVTGFPTLMIIDQEGIVRHFHSGFAPDLKSRLTTHIDTLLQHGNQTAKVTSKSHVAQASASERDESAPRTLPPSPADAAKEAARAANERKIRMKLQHLTAAIEQLMDVGLGQEAARLRQLAADMRQELKRAQADQAAKQVQRPGAPSGETALLLSEIRQLRSEMRELRQAVRQLAASQRRQDVRHAIDEERDSDAANADELFDAPRRNPLPHRREAQRRARQALINDLDARPRRHAQEDEQVEGGFEERGEIEGGEFEPSGNDAPQDRSADESSDDNLDNQ